MKRRDFFKQAAVGSVTAVASTLTFNGFTQAIKNNKTVVESSTPDLVAVMGGEPEVMLNKALESLGGIQKFVKKGQTVVVKPNIGWDKTPEMAANTNPDLVESIIKKCYEAGAKEVLIFDHTCNTWQQCYKNSGIEEAVKNAGGKMLPGNDESYYKPVELPQGIKLKSTKIHEAILDCDVWINVPILKNHGGAKLTCAMKNLMGIVWDRRFFHANNLQQCIADSCTLTKKPVLNIVDAYRVMKTNGPQGTSIKDVEVLKTLIASTDMVAADAAALKFFNQVVKLSESEVGHIGNADKLGVGTKNIDKLNIKRIKL